MKHKIYGYCSLGLAIGLTQTLDCNSGWTLPPTQGNIPVPKENKRVYVPIPLPPNGEVKDVLSDRDIPTGEGGFARDYAIKLISGDQIAIDLSSEVFDTIVILLSPEGKTIGKNDDGPDGGSNSLLFTRIKDTGTYVIRVQGFGETSSGEFKLKVSKLKAQ